MTEYVPASHLAEIVTILRDGDEEARLDAVRQLSKEPADPAERKATLAVLIDVMGDDDWQVRKEAVASVLCWTDLQLLSEGLVEAMGEPDNIGRRNAVIEAVMRLGAVCIDPLLRHLKQKPEHRKVLVDVLGTFGDVRVIPVLGETLRDEDPNVRIASMEQLASFTGEEVLPTLRDALKSTDTLVVLAALDGLNRQRDKLPVAELTPLLSEVTLRPALMTALGHTEDAAAIPALIEGLIEKARGAREAALVGLFRLYQSLPAAGRQEIVATIRKLDENTVRSMTRALMEATPPVREATAALLGWLGKLELARPLVLVLGDSDASVAEAAAQALIDLDPGEAALRVLADILPSVDPRSRGNVCRFFARHAELVVARASATLRERLGTVLVSALTDKNAQSAGAAAQALSMLGDTGHRARLQQLAAGGGQAAALANDVLRKLDAGNAIAATGAGQAS
jgi:HEAT repeat protein